MGHIENFWIDSNTTDQAKRWKCSGCSACESICGKKAITMHIDQEGFMYPVVNRDLCVDCGLCVSVCPISNRCENDAAYLKSFGGFSTNERVINSCASGGVATTLAIATIQNGGSVFGVQYSYDYSSAEYIKIDSLDGLWSLCSSKYIPPSKTGIHALVKEELLTGHPVLFVGCPCDVAALKRYLHKEYDNLLTCELFCAGITSAKLLADYLAMREKNVGSKLVAFNVRNKDKGWFVQHIKEEYENGKIFYKNHFGTYLGYGFLTFRRPSCYHCQYKQNTTYCDIKVGDFWGIKNTDPFWNPKGVSVILAKTQKGVTTLEALKEFQLYEVDYAKATANNNGFVGTPNNTLEAKRNIFAHEFIYNGLLKACKKTAPLSFWIKYYVPSSFHSALKRLYHSIIDKKYETNNR